MLHKIKPFDPRDGDVVSIPIPRSQDNRVEIPNILDLLISKFDSPSKNEKINTTSVHDQLLLAISEPSHFYDLISSQLRNLEPEKIFRGDSKLRFYSPTTQREFSTAEYLRTLVRIGHHLIPKYAQNPLSLLAVQSATRCDGWAFLTTPSTEKTSSRLSQKQALDAIIQIKHSHPYSLREFLRSEFSLLEEKRGSVQVKEVIDGHSLLLLSAPEHAKRCPLITSPLLRTLWDEIDDPYRNEQEKTSQITLPHKLIADLEVVRSSDLPADLKKRACHEIERVLNDADIPSDAWDNTKVLSRTGIQLADSAAALIAKLNPRPLTLTQEEASVLSKQNTFYCSNFEIAKVNKLQTGSAYIPLNNLQEATVYCVREELKKPYVLSGEAKPFKNHIPVLEESFLIRAGIEALDAISPRTKVPSTNDGTSVSFGLTHGKILFHTFASLFLAIPRKQRDFIFQEFLSVSNESNNFNREPLRESTTRKTQLKDKFNQNGSIERYDIDIPLPLEGIRTNSPLEILHSVLRNFLIQIHGRIPLSTSMFTTTLNFVSCRGSDGVIKGGLHEILKSYKVRSHAGRMSTALGWLRDYEEYSQIPEKCPTPAPDDRRQAPSMERVSNLLRQYPTLESFLVGTQKNAARESIVISAKVGQLRDEFIRVAQTEFQSSKHIVQDAHTSLRNNFETYQESRTQLLTPFKNAIKEISSGQKLHTGTFLKKLKKIGNKEIIGSDGELIAHSFQHLVNMYAEVRKQLCYQEGELSRTVLGRQRTHTWKHPSSKSLASIMADICDFPPPKRDAIIEQCQDLGRNTVWIEALSGHDQVSITHDRHALSKALQEVALHTTGRENSSTIKLARQKSIHIKNYEGTYFNTLHSFIQLEALAQQTASPQPPQLSQTTSDRKKVFPLHELLDATTRHPSLKYLLNPRTLSSKEHSVTAPKRFLEITGNILSETFETFLNNAPPITQLSNDDRLLLLDAYHKNLHKHLVKLFHSLQSLPSICEADGTANFGMTPIATADGTVVAECFGHLYSIVVALCAESHHRAYTLRNILKISSYKKISFNSDDAVIEVFGRKPVLAIASLFPSLFAQNHFNRIFTLSSLNTITSESDATLDQKITILKEAALQTIGIREFDPSSSIQLEGRATSTDGSKTLWLESLQRSFRKDLNARSRRSSKSQNTSTAINDEKKKILRIIFEDLDIPTETAFFALCALGEYDETRSQLRTIRSLKRSLTRESEDNRAELSTQTRDKVPPPKELFSKFVDAHSKKFSHEELTEIGRERLAQLFHHLCFHYYGGSFEKIKEELEDLSKASTTSDYLKSTSGKVLRDIIPILLRRYNQIENFQVPRNLPFKPLPHQIASCVAGLYNQKPNFILGPGTGKTKLVALFVQALSPPTTLLLTTGANRADTGFRIAEDLGISVLIIEPEFWRKPLTEQRKLLKQHTFAVASHDTIRILERRHPKSHALIARWVSPGLKALDEVQHIDNSQNKRTTAIAKLKSKHTIALSATPVLHRPERVATLLHLTLPELYPNPRALEENFRQDPNLGNALFQQHAICFRKEDIALPFKPFTEEDPQSQLKKSSPRIATLHTKVHDYYFSAEHSMIYCNLVYNPRAWALEKGFKWKSLCQVNWLRRLTTAPELLGAQPAYSLRNAIKGIAIPALEKGEKVLILSQRLAPLSLLQSDPDFLPFTQHSITGRTPSHERAKIMHTFEEGEGPQIVFGQFRAAGQGFNCRGIRHVIFADLPPTVSEVIQGMHRHHRIITESDLRFALSDVFVHFVQPKIDPRIIEEVKNTAFQEILNKETVHAHWLTKMLDRIEEYKMLTGQLSKIHIPDTTSVATVVSHLAQAQKELEAARLKFKIFNERNLSGCFFRYRSKEKRAWRNDGVKDFVDEHLPLLRTARSDLRVAHLPGPEALEVPVYLEAGIPPKNIDGFEASRLPDERLTCREEMNFFGCNFSESRIEDALTRAIHPYHIISVDSHGPLKASLFGALEKIQAAPSTMLLKNTLIGRDTGETNKLLRAADGSRQHLDYFLLSLFGTRASTWAGKSLPEVVLTAKRVRELTRSLGETLSAMVKVDWCLVSEVLSSITLKSPLIRACSQFRYKSGSGRPLLSTFAVLDQWPDDMIQSPSSLTLQSLIRTLATEEEYSELSLNVQKNRKNIVIKNSASNESHSIDLDCLKATIDYFSKMTPEKNFINRMCLYQAKEMVLR